VVFHMLGFVHLVSPNKISSKGSFVTCPVLSKKRVSPSKRATIVASSFGMNGSKMGSLGGVKYKNSGVANDGRYFKITYCQPSQVSDGSRFLKQSDFVSRCSRGVTAEENCKTCIPPSWFLFRLGMLNNNES